MRPDRSERCRQDDVPQRAVRIRAPRGWAACAAFGDDLLVLSDYERARWGVRRTFQTEQAIEALTVYDNVLTVHEHTTKMRAERRSAVLDAIAFVGLGDVAFAKVGSLSPRQRRLVEVARAVVGGPRAVLLDEPGAGLPEAETEHLGAVIERDPRSGGGDGRARRARHEPRQGVL